MPKQKPLGDELFGTPMGAGRATEKKPAPSGGDLFIVDNGDTDWKVRDYLREWTDLAHSFDIATGYFEIGALLALDGQWQKLDKLRILMGDEVSVRTRNALVEGVKRVGSLLDRSIENEKQQNDFLTGVPGIVEALDRRQIECRVYTKDKFHAKAYITHAKQAVIGSTALVGSSNFTFPGLTTNVELNVQLRREVELLQEWYERHWDEAEDVTPDILRVIERHTRLYEPFDVYAMALHAFFARHQLTASEWEQNESKIFPILDQYQKEGYWSLVQIAETHRGAFLCDGVGLGKTFVGMMVIERLVQHDRKRVALFVPKAARKAVWEAAIDRYLPGLDGDFSNLVIFNHTDLYRGGDFQERLERVAEQADVIVIDEAHHFRNPGIKGGGRLRPSRYRRMFEIAEKKQLFMLTATPINNQLIDLQHMIELFSRQQSDYFKDAPLGIHSLPGHFRRMEKSLAKKTGVTEEDEVETNEAEAEQVLNDDALFKALVVQRSRAYVRESQRQQGKTEAIFPDRADPQVATYSVAKTYGPLLGMLETAFSKQKPLFSLAIYYPLAYYKGADDTIDPLVKGRQRQVVGLIRTQFLKRFESSVRAFELSCNTLLLKLLTFVTKHSETPGEKRWLERWLGRQADLIEHVQQRQIEILGTPESEQDEEDDIVTEEMLESVEQLSRDEYRVDEILTETHDDLQQLAIFLDEIRRFKPAHDDKLNTLVDLLKGDPVMSKHKVLIFTEYMATARYLRAELQSAGIEGVDEIDSANSDRQGVIERFAPYYNNSSSSELAKRNLTETRVLLSTDVLSEGLNLQDATRLINYDIHWNPVRLMQRIGRVDRRMSPEIEKRLVEDHPDVASLRGKVAYWNFLPPDELDELLKLYANVAHKTLRISKTFGIEGRKLLKETDDFDALRDFNSSYEGATSPTENMHLEYQQLLLDYPDLEERILALPGRVFSGKERASSKAAGVFFCYGLPAPMPHAQAGDGAAAWAADVRTAQWYFYDIDREAILEEPAQIVEMIRCAPETPRVTGLPQLRLTEIRKLVEKHITNTYLKQVDAPVGVKPVLRAWMELS